MTLELSKVNCLLKGTASFENRIGMLHEQGKYGQILALYCCLYCHKLKSGDEIDEYLKSNSALVDYLEH